ncbi:unnamed protein product, partial [marine sediment metagenome]
DIHMKVTTAVSPVKKFIGSWKFQKAELSAPVAKSKVWKSKKDPSTGLGPSQPSVIAHNPPAASNITQLVARVSIGIPLSESILLPPRSTATTDSGDQHLLVLRQLDSGDDHEGQPEAMLKIESLDTTADDVV